MPGSTQWRKGRHESEKVSGHDLFLKQNALKSLTRVNKQNISTGTKKLSYTLGLQLQENKEIYLGNADNSANVQHVFSELSFLKLLQRIGLFALDLLDRW